MTAEQRKWHKQQCERYQADYPKYEIYAGALERMLKAACRTRAPLAIVQSRPKGFASFAEKMARKAEKYMKHKIGPTDLCGARVITETQAEVERICEAIRGCQGFLIDKENSVDVSSRLAAAEFGYLSVHYVVQLQGPEAFEVPVPNEAQGLKAEIQVRTLLQHAWASICHDRIYKSAIRVPQRLSRDLARAAALLEEADEQFGASVRRLDAYKLHYGAYMDRANLDHESGISETVREREPVAANRPADALRLAAVHRGAGDWKEVVRSLTPYTHIEGHRQREVQAEHGHALCREHRDKPGSAVFQTGRAELEESLAKGGRSEEHTSELQSPCNLV